MPSYIVTVDNETYSFSEFKGVSYSSYTGMNFPSFECVYKGANIPIYKIWEDFYRSDFNVSEHVYLRNGYYIIGKVLAITDIKANNSISAIVLSKIVGTTMPTLNDRISELNNGQYNYDSTIDVSIRYITNTQTGIDYTKFVYSSNSWYTATLFQQSYSILNLLGVVGWEDGVSTALGNTLCFPFIVQSSTTGYTWLGLSGTLRFNNYAANFNDLVVSEDNEDFRGFRRRDTGEFTFTTSGYIDGDRGFLFQNDYHSGYEPYIPPDYPFENDYNGGGGGTGEYTDTSDTIPIDGVPTNSAIASGFVNAYLLTQQQCNDFHSYMYSDNFLTNVKKLMNDPIDYIMAFMLAPYTPDTSASTNIIIGGTDSEVAASRISSGYKTVDCGTIELKEFWGKFYDYNPYTKVMIYLPFIGVRPLDIDDVMAGTVNLKYRIDVLTGACVATITVNNTRGTNGAIYNFNGNCHSHIPISGKNYLETVTNVISSGVGMAGSITAGNPLGAVTGAINVLRSAKEQIEHAGELTGATGLLSNFTPFLMVSRPSQSLAQNFNHYKGFISNITAQLSSLSGYTQVAELVQTDIHCTNNEWEEINTLLKEGVYL